jgi:hypothetical protein
MEDYRDKISGEGMEYETEPEADKYAEVLNKWDIKIGGTYRKAELEGRNFPPSHDKCKVYGSEMYWKPLGSCKSDWIKMKNLHKYGIICISGLPDCGKWADKREAKRLRGDMQKYLE